MMCADVIGGGGTIYIYVHIYCNSVQSAVVHDMNIFLRQRLA